MPLAMNILIVGLGSIARKHIQALRDLGIETQIYALRSNQDAAPYENVINLYDLNALPVRFDFAIISAPTHLHGYYIKELTNKAIPLFIEKPPLSGLMDADETAALIRQTSLLTYVACNLRFHPCINFLKEFFLQERQNRVNEVNVYCGSYLPDWRPDQDYRKVYSAVKSQGGGVHLDLFHELDYVRWIFGLPDKVHAVRRNSSSLNIDAYDYANYLLEYRDFTANIVLNYYRRDAKRTIEIVFENETWTVDLLSNVIQNSAGEVIYKADAFRMADTYKYQMEYFLKKLQDNRLPMNTFAESLETLKISLYDEKVIG